MKKPQRTKRKLTEHLILKKAAAKADKSAGAAAPLTAADSPRSALPVVLLNLF